MPETWTIERVLTWTAGYLKRKGIESPRLCADLLLGKVLGCDRVHLYMDFARPLHADELAAMRRLIERRIAGEPTCYLLGRREFFGRSFRVDPRVLVPRPETELLVELALERWAGEGPGSALELCTGSGCIALTLAAERPSLQVIATDLSAEALEVARENAQELHLEGRVELALGDLDAPVPKERRFHLLVANPPYVASGRLDSLPPEVRREPRAALDGGPDGLALIRRIVALAPGRLLPGGWLLLEIGEDQGPAVRQLCHEAGLVDVAIRKDFANLDRVALARLPAEPAARAPGPQAR